MTFTAEDLLGSVGSLALQEQLFLRAEAEWIERARPKQILPLKLTRALIMTGRGWGKTDTAANWVRRQSMLLPGSIGHVVAPTFGDLRYVVIEGVSGLLRALPEGLIADYNRSDYTIRLVNETFIRGFSAEKPDRLRGPQCHWLWGDELAAWQRLDEMLANIDFSTRLVYPRVDARGSVLERVQPARVFTTTPRPLEQVRELAEHPKVHQVRGSLYENKDNLAETFLEDVAKHEGTKLGDQEIHGRLLDFDESAIIKRRWIRMWPHARQLPQFEFVFASFDTALTENTYDDDKHEPDFTACTVWGVFAHEKRMCLMLLDAWRDRLGMPELIESAQKVLQTEYGYIEPTKFRTHVGQQPLLLRKVVKPQLLLIEDQGSGRSLRQMLEREKVPMHMYNPGRASKMERVNAVAYIAKGGRQDGNGRIWVPESKEPKLERREDGTFEKTSKYVSWSDQWFGEVCIYTGPGSTKHDDYVDSTSQAWRYFADNYLIGSVNEPMRKATPRPARQANPYGG